MKYVVAYLLMNAYLINVGMRERTGLGVVFIDTAVCAEVAVESSPTSDSFRGCCLYQNAPKSHAGPNWLKKKFTALLFAL